MKILLDAQLPRSLVPLLQAQGCDALHTLDLPDGNRSSDSSISALAEEPSITRCAQETSGDRHRQSPESRIKSLAHSVAAITAQGLQQPCTNRAATFCTDHPAVNGPS